MTSEARFIKVGPAERSCRYSQYFDLKGCNEISQIFISSGIEYGIMSIQFQYVENGKYVLSDQYGSHASADAFHAIELNHPVEYITGVCGLYSDTHGNIKEISFTTNIQSYGPFGVINADLMLRQSRNPKCFGYNLGKSCQFGGFHGTYRNGLVSIC